MSNNALATTEQSDMMERVLVSGDLSKLTSGQRVSYYRAVCESVGLNPLTKPFDYITLNGKLTLYAKRDAADQLRRIHGVSIVKLDREVVNGIYLVVAHAQTKDGRMDSSIGAVAIDALKGDALANAMMKAETKSKRRVTLSIAGLGWLDETETETIPAARPVMVTEEGEIVEQVKVGNGRERMARGPVDGDFIDESDELEQVGRDDGLPAMPKPTPTMVKKFHALGVECYGDGWDDKRPELVAAISGKRHSGPKVTSSKELYRAEMQNLIDGMQEKAQAMARAKAQASADAANEVLFP